MRALMRPCFASIHIPRVNLRLWCIFGSAVALSDDIPYRIADDSPRRFRRYLTRQGAGFDHFEPTRLGCLQIDSPRRGRNFNKQAIRLQLLQNLAAQYKGGHGIDHIIESACIGGQFFIKHAVHPFHLRPGEIRLLARRNGNLCAKRAQKGANGLGSSPKTRYNPDAKAPNVTVSWAS